MAKDPKPYTEKQVEFGRRVMRLMSKTHIFFYKKSNGRLLSKIKGMPVCLLTTTGRQSRLARTIPLTYIPNGDRILLVGSQGGMPTHPNWYLNIVADPNVTVEIEGDARAMRAETASPEERAQLWSMVVARYPGYGDYQARTEREIPVVICTWSS